MMAKPWKKIEGDVLGSTNACISDAGGTDEDAIWVRANDGKNAKLLVTWIHERRAAEEAKKAALELAMQPPSPFRGEFWNERAEAPYWQYPPDWGYNDVLAQLSLLMPHFRGLDASYVEVLFKRLHSLPDGMEGPLTFPKLPKLASLVSGKKGWTDVNKAISYLLGVLGEVIPNFKDRTKGHFGPDYHRLNDTVARVLAEDAARTPGDFHVLPVQSGALYAGYSIRAARGHISARPREYGMPCFMGACLLLANPGRIANELALVMDCPGTERAPKAVGDFVLAPHFCLGSDSHVPEFYCSWIDGPGAGCGSASFVLPE